MSDLIFHLHGILFIQVDLVHAAVAVLCAYVAGNLVNGFK